MKSISEWQTEIHELAKSKGWYDQPRTPLELHMLIVSEIAEATEAARKGDDYHVTETGKPEGEAVELADAVIRILDYAEFRGFNLERIMLEKHEYNKNRSYRHGGKKY